MIKEELIKHRAYLSNEVREKAKYVVVLNRNFHDLFFGEYTFSNSVTKYTKPFIQEILSQGIPIEIPHD